MLDKLLEQSAWPASDSIAQTLPALMSDQTWLPFPLPKANGVAGLKISEDGLDLRIAISLEWKL